MEIYIVVELLLKLTYNLLGIVISFQRTLICDTDHMWQTSWLQKKHIMRYGNDILHLPGMFRCLLLMDLVMKVILLLFRNLLCR
jgi:hypothetical protein